MAMRQTPLASSIYPKAGFTGKKTGTLMFIMGHQFFSIMKLCHWCVLSRSWYINVQVATLNNAQ